MHLQQSFVSLAEIDPSLSRPIAGPQGFLPHEEWKIQATSSPTHMPISTQCSLVHSGPGTHINSENYEKVTAIPLRSLKTTACFS